MVIPEYPFASHFYDRAGQRLHYVDEGAGDPVLMVHGNPTWSYYYRHLIAALRDTHRVIAPDHVGCGLSSKPAEGEYDFALDTRIDDLAALIEHLGLRGRLTLVVHDWGGVIGTAAVTRFPGLLKRLIVLNTAAFRLPRRKGLPWALGLGRDTRLGAFLIRRLNAFAELASVIGPARRSMPAEVRRAYVAPYADASQREATLKFVQTIPLRESDPGYDTLKRLEDTLQGYRDIPVFIGWGLRDFVFDRHFLAKWLRRFPGAEVHRYRRSGHYVLEDERADLLKLIPDFLRRNPIPA